MSASIMPDLLPSRASATARLAASVDLPTPPLPRPTATILRSGRDAVSATRTSATPGIASAAALSRASSAARSSGPSPLASTTSAAMSPLSLLRADARGVGMARQVGKQFVVGHGLRP